MPSKRVSEKDIILSGSIPSRHKPATTKRSKRSTVSTEPEAVSATTPSHEQIAALAYSYWEARGYQGGSPEEDWLRAEQELATKTLTATATA